MPAEIMNYVRRSPKAALAIRFVVIGASIGGLSTAFALRCAGHDVLILEQSSGTARSHGGIRIPPNGSRILNEWGMGRRLDEMSTKIAEFTFRDGHTGERNGLLKLHQQLMKAIRADFYTTQHGDLHTLLYDGACAAGVQILFNTRVERIDANSGAVYVEGGSRHTADVIVGADGCKSFVRAVVLGGQVPAGKADRRTSFNVTVPTALMKRDPDLVALTEAPEWTIWNGNDSNISGYITNSGKEYGMVATVPLEYDAYEEHWTDHIPMPANMRAHYDAYEPRIRKMLSLATSVNPTKYVVRDAFDTFVHESGRVVLVGDAAHPCTPNGSHNASLTLEDAATLGALFSHLQHHSQVPLLLSAYEELRQPRCARVQASERQAREFASLPRGPEQRARDQGLRDAMAHALSDWDHADEEYLRATWAEYLEAFAFDARETVEDWWAKWGKLLDRQREKGKEREGRMTPELRTGSSAGSMQFEVSVSRSHSHDRAICT